MNQQFLPKVEETTIIWADEARETTSKWYSAQGDDLKHNRATIEINLPKIAKDKRGNPTEIAETMIVSWLGIYIVLATRQDLINKRVRGYFSPDGETILEEANFKAIKASPILLREYTQKAISELKDAKGYVYATEENKALMEKVFEEMNSIRVGRLPE